MASKITNPLQDIFNHLQKILEFTEFKDLEEAKKYETDESRDNAEMWIYAILKEDTYLTYQKYWTVEMFQEVSSMSSISDIKRWMNNPYQVPTMYHDILLERGREVFLNSYEEENEYYRRLNGLPPINTHPSEFIYMSEPTRNQLHADNKPIHMLSSLIQNSFMETKEYQDLVSSNPDKKYLKYLGRYKVDLFVARRAKDFEIIRYPINHSDINPNLLNLYASVYDNYREYVMTALYNDQLEQLYPGYRGFMGVIIQMMTLMQIANRSLESVNSRNFLDDSAIHIILSMYNIPDSLLLTSDIRRKLVTNILKLVREKGTDDVYYSLIELLGYQDVVISKLMMVKGKRFDSSGKEIEDGNPKFIQLDLKDENPYDTISSGNAPIYDYHSIVDQDNTWWDLPDTRKILKESQYSIADSKYIVIEAMIHQMKYLFESIYFTRLILDNKETTDGFMIEVPEIFGTNMISIYDAIVYIIAATCMNSGSSGKIVSNEKSLLAIAGFNFDIDWDSFIDFINTTKYVDKDRIMNFLSNLTVETKSDVNRVFEDVMNPMREWLELKISTSNNRREYLEYESIYRALYTYDINRNPFMQDFKIPMEIIRETYSLSEEDIKALQSFYPHTMTGKAITIGGYHDSRYRSPFIGKGNEVTWFIHIILDTPYGEDDRGYVYFYDILNSPDLRELTNPDGTRVFMDWESNEDGWQINQQAVEQALYLLENLSKEELYSAHFQVNTPILNGDGKQYQEGELLPAAIRTGIFKNILIDKLKMDMQGLAAPPSTYYEYLYRKNQNLYNLLVEGNRFNLDKEAWINDVMTIVGAVETELDLHMKYFEQSIAGSEMFFKPLVTLIKHFKSTFITIAKTNVKYVFGDKIDAGGNSNMLKFFDEVKFIIHFVTLANNGYGSKFGLYDAEHKLTYHITMKDRSEILRMISSGFDASVREDRMGSIHLVDEAKFYQNGEPIDPPDQYSSWRSGEPGTGRWENEEDILMAGRTGSERVVSYPVDLDGWKDFVESYNAE